MKHREDMNLDHTQELAEILKFAGDTACAIRMYSAYSGGSPAGYLGRPLDRERESVELMFLADALHHLASVGEAVASRNQLRIVKTCGDVAEILEGYSHETPQFGERQAKSAFEAWSHHVRLDLAVRALRTIGDRAEGCEQT